DTTATTPIPSADTKKKESKHKKVTTPVAAEKPKTDTVPPTVIDLDGLQDRIVALPIDNGNYYGLKTADDAVYYLTNSTSSPKTSLKMYDVKAKKETEIGEFNSFIISTDHKKMLLSKDRAFAIVDLPKDKANMDKKVDLSNMQLMLDRKKEWAQIFNEAWRQMRDFFYDPGMHGLDWEAMKRKYQPLVPYINHRADLNYIIGEMIGELSVGHSYTGGGDAPKSQRIQMGLLGAQLSRDASGYYRIDNILKGENWTPSTRSPLTEVGVDAHPGDFILAVNGVSATTVQDIYQLLVGTAGKTTELTLNSKPDLQGSRKVLVVPTSNEADLYYLDWVRKNTEYVSQKTNGEVGYIHIPNMGSEGLNEFVKHFYPQLQKKAL
ncbi:MAG TPA: PDZ domain-containing protein, partial [Saprospiraceae bacterium]|nr:PDZ domain-containing protein [Saprospiraceae bacterium]